MSITQCVTRSFKTQLLKGVHNFTNVSAAVTAAGAGTGVYTVTLTGGANNGLVGQNAVIAGAGTAANNGTFPITASNATTITTTNSNSVSTGGFGSATATLGDTFKIALYTSSASLDNTIANYATTNEVTGTGYTAGGNSLTSVTPVISTDTAICNFSSTNWTTATITARGALIYNSSKVCTATGGAACVVLDFGSDQTSTAGTFTINFPTADASSAIIRIA